MPYTLLTLAAPLSLASPLVWHHHWSWLLHQSSLFHWLWLVHCSTDLSGKLHWLPHESNDTSKFKQAINDSDISNIRECIMDSTASSPLSMSYLSLLFENSPDNHPTPTPPPLHIPTPDDPPSDDFSFANVSQGLPKQHFFLIQEVKHLTSSLQNAHKFFLHCIPAHIDKCTCGPFAIAGNLCADMLASSKLRSLSNIENKRETIQNESTLLMWSNLPRVNFTPAHGPLSGGVSVFTSDYCEPHEFSQEVNFDFRDQISLTQSESRVSAEQTSVS